MSTRTILAGALLVAAHALLVAACTEGDDGGPETLDPGPDAADEPLDTYPAAALAALDFVSIALEGGDASSLFATTPLADDELGAPFDPGLLGARLRELAAFSGTVSALRPSPAAYPGSDGALAPACGRSTGLFCQVDLVGAGDALLASVVVYWFGDGVTDFSIITRSSAGVANGIGEARCSPGFSLLHGGHTPDRFDIAVCVNDSGELEYNGAERGTGLGIRLDACQEGPAQWVADNEGFRYVVDTVSEVRSTIEVFNPSGTIVEDGPFTTVRLNQPVTPSFC